MKGHHDRVRNQPYSWGTGSQAKGRSVKGERKQASEKEIHFHLYFHSFYCTVADTGSRLNGFRGISSTMTCLWFLIALHRGDSNQITILQAENTPQVISQAYKTKMGTKLMGKERSLRKQPESWGF